MERRLDRSAPLWSIELTNAGEGGSVVVLKVHHAMADGMGRGGSPRSCSGRGRPASATLVRRGAGAGAGGAFRPLRRRWADFRHVAHALERARPGRVALVARAPRRARARGGLRVGPTGRADTAQERIRDPRHGQRPGAGGNGGRPPPLARSLPRAAYGDAGQGAVSLHGPAEPGTALGNWTRSSSSTCPSPNPIPGSGCWRSPASARPASAPGTRSSSTRSCIGSRRIPRQPAVPPSTGR